MAPLTDQTVVETKTATFQCTLSKPNRPVVWKKNGEPIPTESTHYTIECDEFNYILVLKDSTLDDGAEYSIVCEDVESTCTLTVEGTRITIYHLSN